MNEKMLNIKEVRDLLDVSERTVFRLISEEQLKGFKAGREWRFEQHDIDAYIAMRRQKAEEDIQRRRQKRKTNPKMKTVRKNAA